MEPAKELELEIARRKQLEEALAVVNEIAHDFNNLLTAIIGHGDIAARDAGRNSQVRAELNEIQTAADRAGELAHRLLSLCRNYGPEYEADPTPRQAESPGRTQPAPLDGNLRGSETVLLVEDNDMVRLLARRVLEENGYRVIVARDGAEAVTLAAGFEGPIHLVLTDVIMPGASGREVVESLAPNRPGMKALYMSGYTDSTADIERILEAGAAFIEKPFTPLGLARQVRQVLNP